MTKRGLAGVVVLAILVISAYTFAAFSRPNDLTAYPDCLHCGMSRKSCDHTRMSIEYTDGTRRAECSLHCLLADMMEQPSRQPKKILAADYNDKKLVDAERSWWVRYDNQVGCIGGKVMLAFRNEAGADGFVKSHGGKRCSFDEALKMSYLDIQEKNRSAGRAGLQ